MRATLAINGLNILKKVELVSFQLKIMVEGLRGWKPGFHLFDGCFVIDFKFWLAYERQASYEMNFCFNTSRLKQEINKQIICKTVNYVVRSIMLW